MCTKKKSNRQSLNELPEKQQKYAILLEKICHYNHICDILTLTVLILLSVHSLANSLAILVTSSDASAMAFAQAISSLLELASSPTSWESLAISNAIFLAAEIMSLSLLDHCFTSWCRSWAAICKTRKSSFRIKFKIDKQKQIYRLIHTIMGPWLAVGAFWNRSSDSSSVVSKAGGGGGLAGGGACWKPPSAGRGGRGGAAESEMIEKGSKSR